jgi:hypothetical protein
LTFINGTVDLKPPQAAVVKSNGGERCGKVGTRFRQARLREAAQANELRVSASRSRCRNSVGLNAVGSARPIEPTKADATIEGHTMKFTRRKFLSLAATAGAFSALSSSARAQVYPSRPITLIVPFAAGGPTDTIARIVAEGMRASLGLVHTSAD